MKTRREMRQEAVERLRETMKRHPVSPTNEHIVNALVGYDNWLTTTSDDAEAIIDLLTDDDDMDDYAKLPVDADGKTIHIGDEICGYGYPTGGVYCKAIVNERLILAGTDDEPYHEWLMWDAGSCRHYHKQTVEDVLREFVITLDQNAHLSNGVARTIDEYAPRLRLKEDEDERF